MSKIKEKKVKSFPVVPVKDIVVFPNMLGPILIRREVSIKALDSAVEVGKNEVILLAQKNPLVDQPEPDQLFRVGILAKVIQILRFPDGNIKAIVEGVSRVKVKSLEKNDTTIFAQITKVREKSSDDQDTKALLRITVDKFEEFVRKNNRMSPENLLAFSVLGDNAGRLADIITTYLEVKISEKQEILELNDTTKRLEAVNKLLDRETEVLNLEEFISRKLKTSLNQTQKEYYLREKLKVISEELNDDNVEQEHEVYLDKIDKLNLDSKYIKRLKKEVSRMKKLPSYSSELSVVRTYLDRVLDLPWNQVTEDLNDIINAKKVLDEDHYGLEDVKERIIEFLAVKQLSKKNLNTILCLVGPPGVGKTSLAKSVARSLGRKFAYISLGGINDESEIRGHRRTYVGAMPGRIIQAIENAGTNNPVILLDEIEKMMRSHMGDPTAAMLEVLDPEQNVNFTDHFIDMPFDLSNVFFVATANSLDNIYKALKDRLEIIEISGYTHEEKRNIAKQFLVKKQLENHGIKKTVLKISDTALDKIITEYTRESGVRNLERKIAKICRKVATE
ncbi:MAG: endopeptidase La, partial [Vampirovibrionia bacterium]